MNNNIYHHSKIYKIVAKDDTECLPYIGATTNRLATRLGQHKRNFKLWKNNKHNFITSFKLFEQYGPENCEIILIEDYKCDNKEQLNSRERYYIENIDCVNKYIPGRTRKEYYENNKEAISTQQKEYYEDNKEAILEYRKRRLSCYKCGNEYTHDYFYKHKNHCKGTRVNPASIQYRNKDIIFID